MKYSRTSKWSICSKVSRIIDYYEQKKNQNTNQSKIDMLLFLSFACSAFAGRRKFDDFKGKLADELKEDFQTRYNSNYIETYVRDGSYRSASSSGEWFESCAVDR